MVTNLSWGTKRTCPGCGAHFYDLNKPLALCPKCKREFDPAAVMRAKRKPLKRDAPEEKKEVASSALPAPKKPLLRKQDAKEIDAERIGGGIGDIAEMEEVDDIDSLRELSELEEREEPVVNSDDADDEAIIEELNPAEKGLVGNIEDEEASALVDELEEEEGGGSFSGVPKGKEKKKP